jgi:hypothetical protein
MTTLAPLQFPLDSLPDEVGSLFPLLQNLVNAAKGAIWKAGRRLFVVDLFSSHAQIIGDITKCCKPHFSRYHLLTTPEYLISSKTSERETDMTYDLAAFTAKARAANASNKPEVYQQTDGTWSHRFSVARFADKTSAETDLRFSKEWGCK